MAEDNPHGTGAFALRQLPHLCKQFFNIDSLARDSHDFVIGYEIVFTNWTIFECTFLCPISTDPLKHDPQSVVVSRDDENLKGKETLTDLFLVHFEPW